MKFPVDLLADVSQTELERLAHNYMNNLLYSNPDSPERLTLSDSTQVTIDISSVGFVPLYGSSDKQKILALFSPSDPFTAVALYLLDQWWAVDDILKTADPARHGAVVVETVGERIVLYILNRVIYRAKEMSSDELPFLCHGEKDHAKILWNNGEAVGFYSVKPSGSLCNSFSTRSYQLPVMDSIFVRKCQRGKGFGLQMLKDFVLGFKEDCLGLRYPLSPSMYKVCEKYLSQYPGDTSLLWEVEGIGGPNQRTDIASRIQAMEQSAVPKNLSFTEESLVITEMMEKGVVMEAVTTQIKDSESVECTVEIVEEVTVLNTTIEAEVPLTARGRSSGSKRRKTGEKIAEDKPEKVLRVEDIEAETPREEQVSAQQETELHNVSELVQTEGMISVAPEEKGEDAVDTVPEETVMVLDQPATVSALQDLEEADVTLAPMTEEPQVEDDIPQDLTNTSSGSQITVENVASEIGEAEKEYQNEDTAVLVVSEEILGAETLDKEGEKTQIGDTGEKLEKRVTQHEVSLSTYATSEDGKAERRRRTVVKAMKTVQSETPRRQHKLQEGLKEESTVQGRELILRGRTVTKTPTSKCKSTRRSQKVSKEIEKEANEEADENEVSTAEVMEELAVFEEEQEQMTSVKKDVVDVEELTEEKQQLKDEQLANKGEAKKQQQPVVEDTVVKGSSTELPNTAETAFTKENEDERVTDESEKIQNGEKVETSMIGDKQDVSDEIQEPPVAQKRALRGRLKVTPKPKPTRQSKRYQKQEEEHTDKADLEKGGSAGEKKADEQPTDKQMDEHHKEGQGKTADKTEKDISIEESTVLEKSRIPQAKKTAGDVIPSTEVNVKETKEVQEKKETEGEAEIVSLMEAEKEEESISVLRKGRSSAAATGRFKYRRAYIQCHTEEEGEEETPPAEETGEEEEETGQELPEEKGEGFEEGEKSVEMEKDEEAIGDAEQMKDASTEEAEVLTEEDNSVRAVDDISTDTVQFSSAEVEETISAEEEETTVLDKPTAATEVGSDSAITEEEQDYELTDDSPPRSIRKRPRVDSSEKREVDEQGETEATTDKEESDDDKDNKKAKSSADKPKEKLGNLDIDKEIETTGVSQKDDDNEQNMSEEEVEPMVIGKRVLRGRSVPSVTVTPQPKSRRGSAKAQKAEESLSDQEKSTQLAQGEEITEPEVEMEKIEAVAQESVTEQVTVEEEQSAVSETCAEGQKLVSVGESGEETPNANKGMVTEEEAVPVETGVLRRGAKTVRLTRSKTKKRQDDEQNEAAVEKSTEDTLAVETRIVRKGRRSATATTRRKSKRARTQCHTEEGEVETSPAEETGVEKEETWWEEKGQKLEEEEKSVEMEKDKDVKDEAVESAAGGESAIGDAEQMKDASTEEAAVLTEEDNSDKAVDDINTDTVQISSVEVEETCSAEEEVITVLEKPTVAPEVGSDTASVTGVADDVIQEPDTVAAALEVVIPDIVLGEADAPATGECQEKDIGSEIPKLQKATVILVDIKTTCHHFRVKEAEETPVARVHAASEKQQEEENEEKQENIEEKSIEATVEAVTTKKEKLEEDNSEKEKDGSADVDEEMSEAEEALVTETQTVESSCGLTSRRNQQKEEDKTGEGITEKEVDEVETDTDEVEGELESVEKDAVIVIVPVEKKQSAVSEICKEADIPAGHDAEGNLPPAKVDKAMSLEEEEEASVVETRALKLQTKSSKATPKHKNTRSRKQGDIQEEENREDEPAVTTRTLRSGRISASDTQKGKSRRSCKQVQEEEQNVEGKTQSVNKTRVEEDEAAKETAVEKTDKEMEEKVEIEKVEEEAATDREEDLEQEIDMEDGKAVVVQAQDGVEEQLESTSKTIAEKEAEASGDECDERKPAMGGEEVELSPDAVTRSLRCGQKMSKASPKTKSRQSKKQQDETDEGGASAEKSTDGNEPPVETRILRRGRKSDCGNHRQLWKEEQGPKESAEESEVEREEEEARLGSVKEPPTEVDEGKVPEEDKTEMENEELVPVEVGKGVSEEGTMEMTEDEENTAGDAADRDELRQEETDTPLPEPPTDPAVPPPSKEEATHLAEEQQSEEMAPQLSDLQRLIVVLVDAGKNHHDVKEGTAAAKGRVSVQKSAANAEEEQKEGAAQEKVTGFPLGTEKNEMEKVIVEEEQFQDEVEAVTTKGTWEGRAGETAKEEEAKSINDEQEPVITETRTCRGKKKAVKATPSTKLARSRQKKGELKNYASKIQKEEPTVQIRVLRRGRMFSPVTQKCTTKRTHKQLQEREEDEEAEGGEKSTAAEERVGEEKQQQVIDREKKEKLKERGVTKQVQHIEAEMGIDKENTLAEEAVIQQEEEQVNSTEKVGNEETEAEAGQHADGGKPPDVAEEAVTTQDTVKGEQSTSASKEVESAAGESIQETPLTAKDDEAKDVTDREEATVTERVLSSGEKTVRTTISKTRKRQDNDEQNEAAVEKSTEEDELAVETKILMKGRRSATATTRRKSKRARTQCHTEEEGEEETPPAEETGGEEEETGQELPEEKGEDFEEGEKSVEMEKDEDVERAARGETAIGDAEQMKDASTEEAAVLEEGDNSDKAVDDISTDTVQISSAEEEVTTVLEKPTVAPKVGSGTAITEEGELVGASVVPEEEAPAITTRALRSKMKTLPATPSRRSKRQQDQEAVETQQQEEESPEEEHNHELTNDSPPRSVRKRPRVDSSEKGEADERGETETTTDKEESDDDKDNKKAKSSAEEPKEKRDHLDIDREGETAGISQKDDDNQQDMSEEEVEPMVIGKRVLRGRSVPSVTITPQPKSRRGSAKAQKAEESLSDQEKNTQLAQGEEIIEPEVEMEKVDAATQESVTEQMTVEEEQSAASETCAGQELVSVGESGEETPNANKGMVTDEEETAPVETGVLSRDAKTVRITRSKTTKRQDDDEQEEAAVEKSTEEDELAVEIGILRKGRRSATATTRRKSKRARTQCHTEEEGEEETPAEETGGEEEETGQELPEEKGENLEEEEKSVEVEKDKDVEDEEVERVDRGESGVGDAEQMKDASTEEAAVLTEEDNSVKAVDDISTDTVQISSAEVEETYSAEEEETTVIEKPTAATEVGSDTAITDEKELVGDESVVPEEEAPATTRALRSKINTLPATPSRRSKRQQDQEVETQQQEEESPEEEHDHELTNDSPPRSVRKRPRVDSSEKGEADERVETEATTDKEESDGDKDNKKAKSSADEPKEKRDHLDTDREGETAGISQKDDDNQQTMSEEEVEPMVIGKRVLRGRSVPSVTITPQPKSRRGSAKAQKAEESLSDEEKNTQLAQGEEITEPEVEMEKVVAVTQESVTEQMTVEEEQSAVSEACAEGQELVSVGESGEETPNANKGMVTDEEETAPVETGVLSRDAKTVRITRSKTTKRQDDDEQEEAAVEKSTEEDELAVEIGILRKGRRSATATTRRKSKRARTQCHTEEEGEEETPAEETGGEEEETGQELPEEKGEDLEEEEKSVEVEKDKDVEDEEVERVDRGESGVGDAEQMKDASTEEAAVLTEEDNSVKAVDDISTDTVQISSAEVEETYSAEEEETTVIEKPTAATEVGSDTAITDEKELVGDESVVPEEEAPATTRALRSKIKTLPATPSRRSKRQQDQGVVETQQQEEESPEEEHDHELTNDSPPRSVRKRPRVDSSEKGEADERGETEATTDKEESDDDKDNKKAKSSADEPKEKRENLDTDREGETAGISQKDDDNEQNMSEEEVEPMVIGKRVLRGRSVPSVTVTPQPKSRRCSAKGQKAEESLSDEKKCTQLAQKRKSTEVTASRKSKRLSRV